MGRREEIQRLQRESRRKLQERNRAEREAKRAEERKAHDARLKAQAEKRLATLEGPAKTAFLLSGGDPKDWSRVWKEKQLELTDREIDKAIARQPGLNL